MKCKLYNAAVSGFNTHPYYPFVWEDKLSQKYLQGIWSLIREAKDVGTSLWNGLKQRDSGILVGVIQINANYSSHSTRVYVDNQSKLIDFHAIVRIGEHQVLSNDGREDGQELESGAYMIY